MDAVQTLPIPLADSPMIPTRGMSPALQIMLDDKMFDRAKMIAGYLAKADGFVPRHLVGKPEACFAVVMRSITWKLDPFAVAMSTYQTPGGSIGFEGKLCQAILENSGHLEGPVQYEFFGDWEKIQGKFEIKSSPKGTKYPASTWKPEDEAGLGVIVSAQIRNEAEPRRFRFELVQAFPRNSTLWPTDPRTQLQYLAVRRFANTAAPGIFMGIPFDRDELLPSESVVDVNPRPRRGDFSEGGGPTTASATTDVFMFQVVDFDDEARTFSDPTEAAGHFLMLMQDAHKARGADGVNGVWESNGLLITELRERGNDELADKLVEEYGRLLDVPKNSPAKEGNTADAPASESAPAPGKTDAAAPAGDLLAAAEQQRDWPKFGNSMVEKINACQSEADIDKVVKKNSAHLPGYAAWNQNKHDDLMTFVGLRREEIQTAASRGR